MTIAWTKGPTYRGTSAKMSGSALPGHGAGKKGVLARATHKNTATERDDVSDTRGSAT